MAVMRQAKLLTGKNLRILWMRRAFSTAFYAAVLPIALVLFLAYTRYLSTPYSQSGISTTSPLRSLSQALDIAGGRKSTIAFVNSGYAGGAIDKVIETVASTVNSSGHTIELLSDETDLRQICQASLRGITPCYAAVVFSSSPSEGPGGSWNYTLRSDNSHGGKADVKQHDNDAEVYLLPLQHSIDTAIASFNQPPGQNTIPSVVNSYFYTILTEAENNDRIRVKYMDAIIDILDVAFAAAMAIATYHLAGFIAAERESSISQLLEAMLPGRQRWKPTFARIVSYHWAFSISYAPGWIATSVILYCGIFSRTSFAVLLTFHLLTGLALVSFSILGATFFKRAQMSGICVTLVFVILAAIGQWQSKSSTTKVAFLSLLFTPVAYVHFFLGMAHFELKNEGTSLLGGIPGTEHNIPEIVFLAFFIVQIIMYPIMAVLLDRWLYGMGSSTRKITLGNSTNEAVRLRHFTKEYAPNWFKRQFLRLFGRRYKTVVAVSDLSLTALKGQIVVLLGRNGSGKSTTLDSIAGLNKATSGLLELDGSGGIGICPQQNIFWEDLTVTEHLRLFSGLKAPSAAATEEDIKELIRAIDLEPKANARAKTLSGGQKRKLQLGLMLSGGSQLCCVDEVSSGVDPLSRRKIWDILLHKRKSRTMILTTHFLDEADALADHVAIMSRGTLLVEGSSAELKSTLGGGYRIHLRTEPGQGQAPAFQGVQQTVTQDESVYTTTIPNQVADILAELEHQDFKEYYVSGPTMEDVFLKVADDVDSQELDLLNHAAGESNKTPNHKFEATHESDTPQKLSLVSGTRTSVLTQIYILLHKRLILLSRSWLPYAAAIILPIVVAKLAMKFRDHEILPGCAPLDIYLRSYTDFFADQPLLDMVVGPSYKFNVSELTRFEGFFTGQSLESHRNLTDVKKSIHTVDTLSGFNNYINSHQNNVTPGGIFLPDANSPPTFAYLGEKSLSYSIFTQNVLNVFLSNVTIHTQYSPFDTPMLPSVDSSIQFMIVLGIALVAYPGFFALYPNFERVKQIRALQYSNGVRPLPLWMANILFDGVFITFICCIAVSLLSTMSNQWYYIGYLYPIFILGGLASTLFSYFLGQILSSPLTTFAAASFGQLICYIFYLAIYLVIKIYAPAASVDHLLLMVTYLLCAISPACNLLRAMIIVLNLFSVDCGNDNTLRDDPASISLYGGPLLFLSVQMAVFSALVIWNESGKSWLSRRQYQSVALDAEYSGSSQSNYPSRLSKSTSDERGLVVSDISKSYGSVTALENVSLEVGTGEVLALLGPNGAGKSTLISLIRGDIHPTGGHGDMLVNGISVMKNRSNARAQLGVCPQIDAIDQMSVQQHLQFYGRVHGVRDIAHNVREVMRAIGIEQYASRMASKLSGGNKRKLSLAIALIGNPSLLLLDEPGSGIDAIAKRTMWRVLRSVISGRSVLLTTHSMEEADALSVRIGILAKHMLATGTSRQLRAQHGDAYHIHLVLASAPQTAPSEAEYLRAWIALNLPGATEEGTMVNGQSRFLIPRASQRPHQHPRDNDGVDHVGKVPAPQLEMSALFRLLEDKKQELGIKFYSIEETTLDKVFLRIVAQHDVDEMEEETPRKRVWWRKS